MKIEFIPYWEYPDLVDLKNFVKPSTTSIPHWYKKMPTYLMNEKSPGIAVFSDKTTNTTLKACSPFLDGLSFGYTYVLPCDTEIRKSTKDFPPYNFKWRIHYNLITDHAAEQHPTLPNSYNGTSHVYKWEFPFIIKTPPGYSTVFTHPINRHDLPFRTFTGVVDTDTYTIPVNFPFQLMHIMEDILILEKETPICQFFPVKREEWNSKFKEYNEKESSKRYFDFSSKIVRSYKNQFWHKKIFN